MLNPLLIELKYLERKGNDIVIDRLKFQSLHHVFIGERQLNYAPSRRTNELQKQYFCLDTPLYLSPSYQRQVGHCHAMIRYPTHRDGQLTNALTNFRCSMTLSTNIIIPNTPTKKNSNITKYESVHVPQKEVDHSADSVIYEREIHQIEEQVSNALLLSFKYLSQTIKEI